MMLAAANPRQVYAMPLIEPALWHWIAFLGFVLAMLALDLFVLSGGGHEPTFRESLGWTAFWTGLALAFNGLIWFAGGAKGNEAAARFLATIPNARIRSGTWRRLKIEPTKSTRSSQAALRTTDPATARIPGLITETRCSGTPSSSISCRRENSEIVTTAAAWLAACRVSQRRRIPSRDRNHSGCATYEMS